MKRRAGKAWELLEGVSDFSVIWEHWGVGWRCVSVVSLG